MTSLTGQYLELARDAWRYEARGLHGEWVGPGGEAARYMKPDPSRLDSLNSKITHPADHPFFKENPVSAANVVKSYDMSTPDQRAQGMRWYEDAHNIASMIGGGNAEKGAGLLAAYSPQTAWPVNMFNAARAAQQNRALGKEDGMITGAMQRSAQRILDGEPIEQVMGNAAPKIGAFARLITSGGDDPADPLGQVVVDRHAMSVAMGKRLTKQVSDKAPIGDKRYYEHVADQYRIAANELSAREGHQISPHQLQAITWLQQQQVNQAEDDASGAAGSPLAKGRRRSEQNAWSRWGEYARQHHVPVQQGTTVLSQLYADTITSQFAEMGEAMELAGWETELRDPHGAWTRDGDTVHYHGNLGIDRADMPQLSGTLADGAYASSAEMQPRFVAHLQARGIHATTERVPASSLHPTQTTGSIRSIHGIAESLLSGQEPDLKPVVVSSDDRILDGHHTWAARLLAERSRPDLGAMTVIRADVPIHRLIAEATEFGRQQGIKRRATGQVANPAFQRRATVAASTISGQLLDLTGDGSGHHIPGTPDVYRHGWVPVAGGPDTLTHYTQPGGGIEPGRAALHQQIVDSILAGHQPQQHPVATFLGGGTAAGKSTMLASTGPGAPDSAVIDADEIKGRLPEYQDMLAAKDPRAAALVHEESSAISKQAVNEAIKRRLNYTLDGTGDSSYAKLAAKVAKPRAAGYHTVAKYVTVDTDTAVQRAQARAQQTGRMVPETVIREIHAGVSGAYRQAAENNLFDHAELWDTNGQGPQLIARKEPGAPHVVIDEGAYQRFLAKEHQ